MRILHIITSLEAIGGAERMLQRLAFVQARHLATDVHVVSLMGEGPLAQEMRSGGIRVDALGLTGAATLLRTIRRLRTIIVKTEPDVVQTWMYHADLIGSIAARLAGHGRVVWGIRNTDLFPGKGVSRTLALVMTLCARLSARLPSAIVCVAEAARESHIRFGYAAKKMTVIPNGFAEPPPSDPRLRRLVREELGIPPGAFVIGSIARFNPYKDPANFVRAMTKVAAERADATFLMIGREIDTNPELTRWIAESGWSDRFVRTGERRDVDHLFAAMDVFALHSKSEGFPNVLAEAMLAGVPAVATDVGDARLLSGGHAWIVPPQDSAALANAVLEIAALPLKKRRERAAAGRRHILDSYSLESVADRYKGLYDTICAGVAVRESLDAASAKR